jgi:hypothetical protein
MIFLSGKKPPLVGTFSYTPHIKYIPFGQLLPLLSSLPLNTAFHKSHNDYTSHLSVDLDDENKKLLLKKPLTDKDTDTRSEEQNSLNQLQKQIS